jgi:hypothetical protein
MSDHISILEPMFGKCPTSRRGCARSSATGPLSLTRIGGFHGVEAFTKCDVMPIPQCCTSGSSPCHRRP